jgi:hypothetical protein
MSYSSRSKEKSASFSKRLPQQQQQQQQASHSVCLNFKIVQAHIFPSGGQNFESHEVAALLKI